MGSTFMLLRTRSFATTHPAFAFELERPPGELEIVSFGDPALLRRRIEDELHDRAAFGAHEMVVDLPLERTFVELPLPRRDHDWPDEPGIHQQRERSVDRRLIRALHLCLPE